jgi:hypothetical protein
MPDQMTACQIAKRLIDMVFLETGHSKPHRRRAISTTGMPRDKMVGLAGEPCDQVGLTFVKFVG